MIPRPTAILTALVLFNFCHSADKVKTPPPDDPKLNLLLPSFFETLKIKPASIYGVWAVKGTFMYSNVLNIKKDGTFSLYVGSCMGDLYSEGNWSGAGYSFMLKSFEEADTPALYSGFKDLDYYYCNNEQLRVYGDTLYSFNNNGLVGSKYVMVEQY